MWRELVRGRLPGGVTAFRELDEDHCFRILRVMHQGKEIARVHSD